MYNEDMVFGQSISEGKNSLWCELKRRGWRGYRGRSRRRRCCCIERGFCALRRLLVTVLGHTDAIEKRATALSRTINLRNTRVHFPQLCLNTSVLLKSESQLTGLAMRSLACTKQRWQTGVRRKGGGQSNGADMIHLYSAETMIRIDHLSPIV